MKNRIENFKKNPVFLILLSILIIIILLFLLMFYPKLKWHLENLEMAKMNPSPFDISENKPLQIISNFQYNLSEGMIIGVVFLCNQTGGCNNSLLGIESCIDNSGEKIQPTFENYYFNVKPNQPYTAQFRETISMKYLISVSPEQKKSELAKLAFPLKCDLVLYSSPIGKIPDCSKDICYFKKRIDIYLVENGNR